MRFDSIVFFRKKNHIIWVGLFLAFVLSFSSHSCHAFTSLKDIRSWTSPENTRIVFDLGGPLLFEEREVKDTSRIIIEFLKCRNATNREKWHIESSLIKYVVLKDSGANSIIADIGLSLKTTYNIFYLQRYKTMPDRIVIDIKNPVYPSTEQETTKEIETLKKENWIVVIDPGHGGEDPGAIGRNGCREKDVVLSVGRDLSDLLNKEPGIKAYMTRKGDYFISLRERINIAHRYNADLFLSLHANACRRDSASGASIYYLSRDGASDEASALLADRENASDMIGGIPMGKDTLLDSILIDLAQTYTINESIELGDIVLKELTKIKGLKKEGLKCANFGVLKSPSIPSVLVELAYLTNKDDLKMLGSKKVQHQMAQMISGGVTKFFKKCPPKSRPDSAVAGRGSDISGYRIHVVSKGETLWRIASTYRIPLDILREINGLNDSAELLIGQKIKIPSY